MSPVQTTTSTTTPYQRNRERQPNTDNHINTDPGIYHFCGSLQVRQHTHTQRLQLVLDSEGDCSLRFKGCYQSGTNLIPRHENISETFILCSREKDFYRWLKFQSFPFSLSEPLIFCVLFYRLQSPSIHLQVCVCVFILCLSACLSHCLSILRLTVYLFSLWARLHLFI